MRASGSHKLWLYQVQAALEGELHADLAVHTRGGPFSLSNGEMDLALDSLLLNGSRQVVSEGRIKGNIELLPFVLKENRGLKSLAFLKTDALISAKTESLAFLNLYLNAFQGMKVDGSGNFQGRIHLDQGKLQSASDLKVSAHELALDFLGYRVEGEGNIGINIPEDNPETRISIEFGNLDAFDIDGQTPMFSGDGLVVEARGTTEIIPVGDHRPRGNYLGVSIPSVKVPDMKPYQRFLPDKWAVKLLGGEGELQGKAELSSAIFNTYLEVTSKNAEIGVKDYSFQSNLEMGLKVDSPSLELGKVDISGTYFKLQEAELTDEGEKAEPWQASINIEKGTAMLKLAEAKEGEFGVKHFLQAFQNKELKSVLASADEELKVNGSISDLRWLNLLLKNPYGFTISGSGKVTANVVVNSGRLNEGTNLIIDPQELVVDVLDYRAKGSGGGLELKVIEGGEFPDMILDVAVTNAQFGGKGDEQAFVEDIDIELQALARDMRLDGSDRNLELRMKIPSAQIQDMSVYNQYLPEQSPLQILGGEASLVADILLKSDAMDGYVQLTTKDLRAHVDEQDITGKLTADIKLVDGIPKNMEFDISGSSLKLDSVKVVGEQKNFRDEDWAVRFDLTKARAVWMKPVRLDLEAEVEMSDSIPIVAILDNQRGKHSWLGKALTIDDVSGEVRMQMANDQIVIPYAFAGSDKIDVGAKGITKKETNNGVFYVRYRKLHGILKIQDGERNIDMLEAREKFDNYSTDSALAKRVSE